MDNELIKVDPVVLEKKQAWSEVGEYIHYTEISLQQKADLIIGKLVIPTKYEDVQAAEEALKTARKENIALIEERMTITDQFRAVADRLMKSEKKVSDEFPKIEGKLITIKAAKAAADKLVKAKEDEFKRLKESCIKFINDKDLEFKTTINNQVSFAYEYALGKGDINEKTYAEYYKKVEAKFTKENFLIVKPEYKLFDVKPEEFDTLWIECQVEAGPPLDYISLYKKQLTEKFGFFTISLKNKETALKHSKDADAKAAEELSKENTNKNVAASLSTMATTYNAKAADTVKPLKTVYELDMEETHANGLLIIAAYVGNYDATKEYTEKLKAFNLKVEQMANALVSLKNKDEKFTCTGIKFKQVEKLK